MRYLTGLITGLLFGALAVHVAFTEKLNEAELVAVEAQGDALEARETLNFVINKARVVRQYNQKTGYSEYRFYRGR